MFISRITLNNSLYRQYLLVYQYFVVNIVITTQLKQLISILNSNLVVSFIDFYKKNLTKTSYYIYLLFIPVFIIYTYLRLSYSKPFSISYDHTYIHCHMLCNILYNMLYNYYHIFIYCQNKYKIQEFKVYYNSRIKIFFLKTIV